MSTEVTLTARSHGRAANPNPWLVLALVCLAQFMVVLDATIVNVALPTLQADLDFSPSSLQWVINAYTLVFGGFLLLGGRAADLFGRRAAVPRRRRRRSPLASLLDGLAPSVRHADRGPRRCRASAPRWSRPPRSRSSPPPSPTAAAHEAHGRLGGDRRRRRRASACCSAASSPSTRRGAGSSSSTSRSASLAFVLATPLRARVARRRARPASTWPAPSPSPPG